MYIKRYIAIVTSITDGNCLRNLYYPALYLLKSLLQKNAES